MTKLEEQSSEALAARVVAFRALNIGKDEAILAMQILHDRKKSGDTFDYLKYIDDKIADIPKLESDKMKNIKTVIKNVRSGNF